MQTANLTNKEKERTQTATKFEMAWLQVGVRKCENNYKPEIVITLCRIAKFNVIIMDSIALLQHTSEQTHTYMHIHARMCSMNQL